jgi:hypothetical protein
MAERKQNSPPQEPILNPNSIPQSIMEQIINDINQNKNKYIYDSEETIQTDYLDPNECISIITKYTTLHDIPFDLAIAGITKLIQNGGTNQSKQNLIVKVNNKEFELNKFRSILQSHSKTLTVRKFAKGARKLIITIALNNKWPGPLTKELSRINPNLTITPELAPWCNEIHSDNYECPNEIRDALIRREEQLKLLFSTVNKTNKKPLKLRGKSNNKNKK